MDLQYLLFLQEIRERLPLCVEKFFAFTSALTVNPFLYVIPFIIYWSVDKRKGQIFMTAVWLGNILNSLAKLSVCCYRPWIRSAAIHPSTHTIKGATGYSFPSGHTTNVTAFFGTLGWLYKNRSRALFAACCAFIALVAFSRNYLGVHTVQDVIFGIGLGILSTWLAIKFVEWAEANTDKDAQALVLALGIVALIFIYYVFKNYPRDYKADGSLLVDPKRMMKSGLKDCGYISALTIGWFVERRFVNFSTDIKTPERIARALIGAALMGLCFFGISPIVAKPLNFYLANYVKGFLTVAPGALFAPLLFKPLAALFEKKSKAGQA